MLGDAQPVGLNSILGVGCELKLLKYASLGPSADASSDQ